MGLKNSKNVQAWYIHRWFLWNLLLKSNLFFVIVWIKIISPSLHCVCGRGEICEIVLFTFANPLESFSGSKSKVIVSYIFFHFIGYLFVSPIHVWILAPSFWHYTAGLLHWPINFKQMNQRKNAMWSINDGVAGDALKHTGNSCGRFSAKKTTSMVFPVLIWRLVRG